VAYGSTQEEDFSRKKGGQECTEIFTMGLLDPHLRKVWIAETPSHILRQVQLRQEG
jgi:hypothetical protein